MTGRGRTAFARVGGVRLLICVCLLAWSAGWAATLVGDVAVSATALAPADSTHGYFVGTVRLDNTSTSSARRVDIVLNGYRHRRGLAGVSRAVELGPGSIVRVPILVPALPFPSTDGITVRVDGGRWTGHVMTGWSLRNHVVRPSYGTHDGSQWVRVLVSRSLVAEELTRSMEQTFPADAQAPPYRSQVGTFRAQRADTPVADWPVSWLAYTRYDGVVVTGEELADAPQEVQTALWQFAECGGSLVVLGRGTPPGSWARMALPQPHPQLRAWRVGFGHCTAADITGLSELNRTQLAYLNGVWKMANAPWTPLSESSRANSDFPVTTDTDIPMGGIFLLMIVFAILAGPVNLVVLARHNRRIWLFLTTPAVATVTSVLVVLYLFFCEGITPLSRVEGVTLLDQQTHRAITLGLNAYYCPIRPRKGLSYSLRTEVTPRAWARTEFADMSPRLVLGEQQWLRDGWVPPRMPAQFALRTNEYRTERVHVETGEDGRLYVTNGLGADIRELWLADARGVIHHVSDIPAGERQVALPVAAGAATVPAGAGRDYGAIYRSTSWHAETPAVMKRVESMLLPDSYIALLKTAPFVEDGLQRGEKRTTGSTVIGLLGSGEEMP